MVKLLLRLLSALGVILLAVAYLLSWDRFTGLFRDEIEAHLAARFGTPLEFDSVRVNLLWLRLQVEGVRVTLPEVGEIGLQRLDLELAPGPLLHGRLQGRRLRLVEPRVAVAELRALPSLFAGLGGQGGHLAPFPVEVEAGAVSLFDFAGANAVLLEGINATLDPGDPAGIVLHTEIATARLTAANVAFPPATVAADLGMEPGKVILRRMVLASRSSRLRGSGEVVVGETLAASHGIWQGKVDLDLADLRCLPGEPEDLRGTLHFTGRAEGPLTAPTISGRLGLAEVVRGPLQLQAIAADVTGSGKVWRIEGIDGVIAGARAQGAVDLDLGQREAAGRIQVSAFSWAALRDEYQRWRGVVLPDLPFAMTTALDATFDYRQAGGLTFQGDLQGEIAGLGVPPEAIAERPGAILNTLPPATFHAGLRRIAGDVLVEDGIATIGDGQARVAGRIGPGAELDLAVALVNADSTAVAQLLGIDLTGIAWADGRVTGSGAEWRFDGDVHGRDITIFGEELARVEGCLHLDEHGATMAELDGLPVATAATGPWVRGDLEAGKGLFELALRGRDLPLAAIHYLDPWPFLSGRGTVGFAIHGPAPLRFDIDGDLSEASAWEIPVAPLRIAVRVADQKASWEASGVDGAVTGRGEVALTGARPVQGEGQFHNLSLERLRHFLPRVLAEREPTGVASGHYRVSGTTEPVDGLVIEATIDDVAVQVVGRELTAAGRPVTVRWRNMGIEFDDLRLTGGGVGIDLLGRVGADGALQLTLQAEIAADTVAEAVPWCAKSDGQVAIFADIGGMATAPDLSGGAVIDGLEIPLPALGLHIGGLSAEAIFSGGQILVDRVHADVGGGTLTGEGFALFADGRVDHVVFDGRVVGVEIERFGAHAKVNGELQIRGEPTAPLIAGDLIVGELIYDRPVDAAALGRALPSREPTPAATQPRGPQLDLRLRAPETIVVRNNLLDLRLGGQLNLVGPLVAPGLLGALTGSNGTFHLRDRDLLLNAVSITFVDPEGIEPILEVQGETVLRGLQVTPAQLGQQGERFEAGGARNYYVTFMVAGPLDDLSIRASSTPPLDEGYILASLMGSTIGGELGETATNRFVSLLSGGLRKGLGSSPVASLFEAPLEELLRFDRIDIDPFAVSRSNVVSPRLTLGRDLSERLALIYSTSFVANEEPLIELQYRLSDKWQLLGNKNEIGSLGADLRYEFRF